jgi:hypothetical protein
LLKVNTLYELGSIVVVVGREEVVVVEFINVVVDTCVVDVVVVDANVVVVDVVVDVVDVVLFLATQKGVFAQCVEQNPFEKHIDCTPKQFNSQHKHHAAVPSGPPADKHMQLLAVVDDVIFGAGVVVVGGGRAVVVVLVCPLTCATASMATSSETNQRAVILSRKVEMGDAISQLESFNLKKYTAGFVDFVH